MKRAPRRSVILNTTITSQVIPIATVAFPAPPVSAEQAPVTPEEVAALARRIRVEAKLSRITIVGCILGIVCGVAAVAPFLDSDGYMAETLVNGNGLTFLPGWLLAGLLPLLAFYAGRLQFQTTRSSTGQIEASLRKIRWVILGAMFASASAFVFVLTQRGLRDLPATPWMTLMYGGCFAACTVIVGDVRRGLGDFDTEQQRRRRKLVRGFSVQFGAPDAFAPTVPSPPGSDIAMASRAGPVLPVLPSVPSLPALPLTAAMDVEDDHFKDLRLLLTLAILIGIAVHATRLGQVFTGNGRDITEVVEGILRNVTDSATEWMTSLAAWLMMLSLAARVSMLFCGVLWVAWGILALNFGPGFRRLVFWLTIATAVLALASSLPAWLYNDRFENSRPGSLSLLNDRLNRAPELLHAALMWVLLTRPGVRQLFSRENET